MPHFQGLIFIFDRLRACFLCQIFFYHLVYIFIFFFSDLLVPRRMHVYTRCAKKNGTQETCSQSVKNKAITLKIWHSIARWCQIVVLYFQLKIFIPTVKITVFLEPIIFCSVQNIDNKYLRNKRGNAYQTHVLPIFCL